jgi:hypothetical protein
LMAFFSLPYFTSALPLNSSGVRTSSKTIEGILVTSSHNLAGLIFLKIIDDFFTSCIWQCSQLPGVVLTVLSQSAPQGRQTYCSCIATDFTRFVGHQHRTVSIERRKIQRMQESTYLLIGPLFNFFEQS